ncbi:gamma-glutamylcyclotransferase family protein [Streptomyces sp. NPDC051018]|uniref:gamma-glutamylcyclotransferase family protein n=1 Tax=Streptomyces sp. NPDC051018 TaxID=3365639 RepID=UPI0037A860A3
MTAEPELPFFVYGTLRPGRHNHDLLLRGRTAAEEPGFLPGAVLYHGPGYPYAVETPGDSRLFVTGELLTAAPGRYEALVAALDELEGYNAPGHSGNLYERVARDVLRPDGTPVRAWVYLAAAGTTARLRSGGTLVPGGDWPDRTPARRARARPAVPHTP